MTIQDLAPAGKILKICRSCVKSKRVFLLHFSRQMKNAVRKLVWNYCADVRLRYLECVEVINFATNESWFFPCSQWLDKSKGDKKIERDLVPGDKTAELTDEFSPEEEEKPKEEKKKSKEGSRNVLEHRFSCSKGKN